MDLKAGLLPKPPECWDFGCVLLCLAFFVCLLRVDSFCARMSELIEKETEEYRKGDPDPFDDRHPGKMYILLCLRIFYFVFLLKKGLAVLFRQVQNS